MSLPPVLDCQLRSVIRL